MARLLPNEIIAGDKSTPGSVGTWRTSWVIVWLQAQIINGCSRGSQYSIWT